MQGANDTNTKEDREQIQKEIEQLKLEIDSISEKTEFNTRKLLNGSSAVLSSISNAGDNQAKLVNTPTVVDPRLTSGEYHIKVEDISEVVNIKQVGAGVSDSNDIKLSNDLNSLYYPQEFGEYTINIRGFFANTAGDSTQYSAAVQVIGPNGLPLEERSVNVFSDGDIFSIGGLDINTASIKEAGTIKVTIEQKATYTIYIGDSIEPANKIASEKTMTTKEGTIKHGGMEFTFDNTTVAVQGEYSVSFKDPLVDEQEIEIAAKDGTTIVFKFKEDESEDFATIEELKHKINENNLLNQDFVASIVDGKLILTEKVGSEGIGNDETNALLISGSAVEGFMEERAGRPLSEPVSTKFSITNNALAFQIGPNTNQNVMIDVPRLDIVTLGIEDIDVTSQDGANMSIFAIDKAINVLSDVRAKIGATQNRMEHTMNNLRVTHENLTASESRIRDADMALEMTEFTRNNILNQSATAMLAQANQLPQGILQLLQ